MHLQWKWMKLWKKCCGKHFNANIACKLTSPHPQKKKQQQQTTVKCLPISGNMQREKDL